MWWNQEILFFSYCSVPDFPAWRKNTFDLKAENKKEQLFYTKKYAAVNALSFLETKTFLSHAIIRSRVMAANCEVNSDFHYIFFAVFFFCTQPPNISIMLQAMHAGINMSLQKIRGTAYSPRCWNS